MIDKIGKVMGVETIAECVENTDVLRAVAEIGVDYAQGYAINEPASLEDDDTAKEVQIAKIA
jgi:EAL domain-containing protein (putative c-di-GMP-specific phosphodiesterase class I)